MVPQLSKIFFKVVCICHLMTVRFMEWSKFYQCTSVAKKLTENTRTQDNQKPLHYTSCYFLCTPFWFFFFLKIFFFHLESERKRDYKRGRAEGEAETDSPVSKKPWFKAQPQGPQIMIWAEGRYWTNWTTQAPLDFSLYT